MHPSLAGCLPPWLSMLVPMGSRAS
jgi:hypothetical protein